MTTTNGQLYLTALGSLERLEIQFMPQELTPVRTANWAEIAVVSRNNPIHHYTGGSNTLSLTLDFYCEEENRRDVIRKCRLLESWAMNNADNKPPERIRLTFGRVFKENEVWIISNVSVTYSQFSPLYDMLPMQSSVQLDLMLDTTHNRNINEVLWK